MHESKDKMFSNSNVQASWNLGDSNLPPAVEGSIHCIQCILFNGFNRRRHIRRRKPPAPVESGGCIILGNRPNVVMNFTTHMCTRIRSSRSKSEPVFITGISFCERENNLRPRSVGSPSGAPNVKDASESSPPNVLEYLLLRPPKAAADPA